VRYIQNWRRLRPRRHPVYLRDKRLRGLTLLGALVIVLRSPHWLKIENPALPQCGGLTKKQGHKTK
jgi:hypothetical protein